MKVTVYSSPNCMPCRATKRALTKANVPFTDIDVSEDATAAEHLKTLGFKSTPVVEVELPDGMDRWSDHRENKIKALASIAERPA
ncbi:hypothetical protein CH305_18285 [Rhodococcus sp. 15-649-2-2]|uniref:glutaredoxin domain-containing protein n=1 Tax=Rhodococcus sp. 15-649-2-2 TaxID=2023140 RepID=UPI000B9B0AB2|nr:glutaredoxin domain-containing protein [Rhodococcus sp. 15-649-2-2]OZE77186.1 hypothetical protein CH305_18285 [Rhodococcus sp. 15-649-2-2]